MTQDQTVNSDEFVDDLAGYLGADNLEEETHSWEQLVEKYPFEALGNGRYRFLPEDHENVSEELDRFNYLVDKPGNKENTPIDYVDGDLQGEIKDYLRIDDAIRKLEKLAELEDRYNTEEVSENKVRLSEGEETGIEISKPDLDEVASTLNTIENENYAEMHGDREMLGAIATEISSTAGTIDKTVYKQGSSIWVYKDRNEELKKVEHIGEEVSLRELMDSYRMINDDESKDSGKEIFDSIRDMFGVGVQGDYEVLLDTVNDEAVLVDIESIDIGFMDLEEANSWLSNHPEEDTAEMIADFWDRLHSGR
jgi:hypothetical protein